MRLRQVAERGILIHAMLLDLNSCKPFADTSPCPWRLAQILPFFHPCPEPVEPTNRRYPSRRTRPLFAVLGSRPVLRNLRNSCAYVVLRALCSTMRRKTPPSSPRTARPTVISSLASRNLAIACCTLEICSANASSETGVATEPSDSTSVSTLGSGDTYVRRCRLAVLACSDASAALDFVLFLGPVGGVVLSGREDR
ncbi:hypothetical protein LZ30DRAFT_356395 [Colletotrichum cereale]|nr:hypothetical protein LZ30DRAFT_356395 [Colletotrichum cereale]